MKKILTLCIFCLLVFITTNSYSQLANSNTYLLSNLNQHPGSPQGSAKFSALWGYKASDGREYALLGCDSGTAFIDITDSADIREVDFVPGLVSDWREMKTYSHYAYVVSEATNSKLQIIDLQYLPDSVSVVNNGWSFAGSYTKTHSIQQSGPYLYLHGGNVTSGGNNSGGLVVIDVTNPEAPVKRGAWSDEYVHDSRVIDDTIYACNIYDPPGTISVISAVNKDALTNVTSWVNNPNPFPHNIALTTDKKYAFTTDETSSPNGKLKVWDIQNLQNVTYVTSWQPTGISTAIVHNVEVYGDYAVIAHYSAGIRIVDISNPTMPTEVAWYDTYTNNNSNNFNGCWGVYKFPSGKIIASDRQKGLFVIKTNIEALTEIPGNTTQLPEGFALSQNYPNPFNPSTKINFSIPKNSNVTLKIYSISGKEVATVINDRRDAGVYEVSFDGSKYGLASGVYFYKLQSGDFVQTKKMILTK
jgi:choice-of-anchor B domain-containing protein